MRREKREGRREKGEERREKREEKHTLVMSSEPYIPFSLVSTSIDVAWGIREEKRRGYKSDKRLYERREGYTREEKRL